MSHSSFTASERRGIIAIAVISLLLIGGGILVSLLRGNHGDASQYPVVVEHPEMVDSSMIEKEENKLKVHKKGKKQKVTTKERREKQYRRRSPLDEPV